MFDISLLDDRVLAEELGTKQSCSKSYKSKAALPELFWSPDWANSSDEKKHITGKNSLWVNTREMIRNYC